MNISCDMAIDLLSLYMDGAASEDSKRAVREHLAKCPSCARIYKSYKTEMARGSDNAKHRHEDSNEGQLTVGSIAEKYKSLAESLRKKRLTDTVSVTTVVALSVSLGAVAMIKLLLERGE